MIQLQQGMKVHAKKVDIHVGNNVLSYNAPRGKKFALVLMSVEDPKETDNFPIDKWLNDMGWELKKDE